MCGNEAKGASMNRLPLPTGTIIALALGFIVLVIVLFGIRRLWRRMRRPRWENCEIQWLNPEPTKGLFFADVSDARGQPARISSRAITLYTLQPDKHDPDHVRALNGIITGLEANGWQMLNAPGKYWYSYRFRRPAR
jgi:hypothetical protein